MQRVYEQWKCNLQECKGKGLENSNAIGDTDVFPVVPIGGAILHPYNLVFSQITRDVIPLPAPALFDPIARGRYRIMPGDIVVYRNNLAAAQEEPQQWDEWMPAPQDPYYHPGY